MRTNLINIWKAANDPTDPNSGLDVATIGRHLHTNLQQSAFTDANGAHAAGLADVLVSPFTVESGKSSGWITSDNSNPGKFAPLHSQVPLVNRNLHPSLPRYSYGIYDPINNPRGLVPVNGFQFHKQISAFGEFEANFANYISPGENFPREAGANPIGIALNAANLNQQEKKNVIQMLYREQVNFSRQITVRRLEAGEILARCCQLKANEPGGWWVKIQAMPLSIADVRDGIAVKSEWNQNGNLEFFIVPEGCNIVVLEGPTAAQQLSHRNQWRLPVGKSVILVNGEIRLPQECADINTQYLRGGSNQIAITGNWNGRPGVAFQPYMSCLAILETGFDVELDAVFDGMNPQ